MIYIMDHRDWSIRSDLDLYITISPKLYTIVELKEIEAKYKDLVILKDEFKDNYCSNIYSVLSRRYDSVDDKTYVQITGMKLIHDGDYFIVKENPLNINIHQAILLEKLRLDIYDYYSKHNENQFINRLKESSEDDVNFFYEFIKYKKG